MILDPFSNPDMLFLNRRKTRSLSGLILLMLLFAQSLLAAAPCQVPEQKPAMAFTDMADMDCAMKFNPNACLQQYVAADQSSSQVQVAVAATPAPAALTVTIVDCEAIPPAFQVVHSVHSPDPPPSIRFCSFQL